MSVSLSLLGGAAAQFLDNSGNPLTGGKIYTYLAGTTTPATVYSDSTGATPHSNPLVLDSAGRVPGGEIWLTDSLMYKFTVKTAGDATIGTYDNVTSNTGELLTALAAGSPTTGSALVARTVIVVADKAALKQYTPDVGRMYFVLSDDGGEFVGKTSGGPFAEDGGSFCGSIVLPNGGDGTICFMRPDRSEFYTRWYGAAGDNVIDDYTAINTAVTAAAGKKLVFDSGKTYRYTQPLVMNNLDVDFNGSSLHYDGAAGSFALTLESNASGGTAGTCGNVFDNLTLYQDNFAEYTTVTGSGTWDPPSIASGVAISSITPGGVSTTISVPGATVGGYARATLSSIIDGMEITAWVSAPNVVTVWLSNYTFAAVDLPSGTVNVTVVNNAYHGLCIGGVLGHLRNCKIRGFTGVTFGTGDGRDVVSGVQFSGLSRLYYWRAEANIVPAAGWGMIIPPRNNENEFSLSTFAANYYNEVAPRRANMITQLVIGGITNSFRKISLEGSASEATVVLLSSSNMNTGPDNGYIESNSSWATPPYPRVLAKVGSSGNKFWFRHPYNAGKLAKDDGIGNDIRAPLSYGVNGSQTLPPYISRNMVVNGDFSNGTNNWINYSTGSVLTVTGSGVFTGKRARLDLTNGRPQLQQDIHTVSGINLAGLVGQNITVGCWIKTNIAGVKPRLAGVTGNIAIGDGTDEFVSVTIKVQPGTSTLPLVIITDASNLTGYVEISNVTCVVGNQPIAYGEPTALTGSATYNPPSIAAAGQASTTVTVTGAVLGGHVTAAFSLDLQGVELSAYVSAADTVTCLFKNGTGGAVDLASGTLTCRVIP